MTGSGFGAAANTSVTVQYGGYVAANCSVVVDDAVVQCTSVAGVGSAAAVSTTSHGLSFAAPTVAYAPPCLTRVSGPGAANASSSGGEVVVLTGGNFGPIGSVVDYAAYGRGVVVGVSPLATLGRVFFAVDCAVTVADVEMTCHTAPAVGDRLVWTVSVAGQAASGLCASPSVDVRNVTTSVAAPVVSSAVVTVSGDAAAGLLGTEGGAVVTVVGANFGAVGDAAVWLAGVRVSGVVQVNGSVLQVHVPAGSGVGKALIVVVANQSSSQTVVLAYSPPQVVSVSVLTGT